MSPVGNEFSRKVERVQNAVRQLPAAAANLNAATDQLGQSVGQVDAALKRFGLGIPTWFSFSTVDDGGYYYSERIGYAKIGGKWGIAIRTEEGHEGSPENETVEQWLFNDSPRLLRVNAVERIPELLEELLRQADAMTKKVIEETARVDAFTAAINGVIAADAKPAQSKASKVKAEAEVKCNR